MARVHVMIAGDVEDRPILVARNESEGRRRARLVVGVPVAHVARLPATRAARARTRFRASGSWRRRIQRRLHAKRTVLHCQRSDEAPSKAQRRLAAHPRLEARRGQGESLRALPSSAVPV